MPKITKLSPFFSFGLILCLNIRADASQGVYKILVSAYEAVSLKKQETTLDRQTLQNERDLQEYAESLKWRLQSGAEANVLLQGTVAAPREPEWSVAQRPLTLSQSHVFSASKTLYDFGRSEAQSRKIDAQERFLGNSELSAQRAAKWMALRDTFALAKAKERVLTTEALLDAAKRRTRLFDQSFRKGERSSQDLLLVKIQENRVRGQVQTSESEWLQTLEKIRAKSNVAQSALENSKLTVFNPAAIAKLIPTLRDSMANLSRLQKDPQWLKLEGEKVALQAELEAVKFAEFPLLVGTFGARAPGQLRPLRPQLYAGLTLDWTLPTSGDSFARQESLVTKIGKLSLQQQELLEALRKQEAETALVGLSFEKEWESLLEQEKLLQEWEKVLKSRQQSGRATAIEVAAAEDSLVNLEIDKWNFVTRWREKIFERSLAQENWSLAVSFFGE